MKLSKQGWAVALLGMDSVEALEGMQEQVAPIVGAYTTAPPEEQKELLTEMLDGLSWPESLINDEVTLSVEAATNEINKPLTIHYNTTQYKAAVWHVYKKNFTEQGGAIFANYLEAQERLDRLIVDATKSGMISSAGFLVTADKAGENEYYVDVYVQPCFGEYTHLTTLEIVQ